MLKQISKQELLKFLEDLDVFHEHIKSMVVQNVLQINKNIMKGNLEEDSVIFWQGSEIDNIIEEWSLYDFFDPEVVDDKLGRGDYFVKPE